MGEDGQGNYKPQEQQAEPTVWPPAPTNSLPPSQYAAAGPARVFTPIGTLS